MYVWTYVCMFFDLAVAILAQDLLAQSIIQSIYDPMFRWRSALVLEEDEH